MNKITAFIRLDFFTLKPYARSYMLMLAMSLIMGIVFKSVITLSMYIMMCLILSLSYPFSIGETNKLDTLYATLSLGRKKVVAGRYAFAVCMELIVVLVVWCLANAISAFGFLAFSASELVVCLSMSSILFSIMLSIQYPIYFKLGYNKAKFLAYIPVVAVCLVVFIINGLSTKIGIDEKAIEDFFKVFIDSGYVLLALPVAAHLLILLSYKLSCRFYGNRYI